MLALALTLMLAGGALAYKVEQHNDEVTGQFVVSPTKYDLDVTPGQTLSRPVVIVNRTGKPTTFEFSVEDFEGSSDPSVPMVLLGDQNSRWGARNWFSPELNSIVLKQGETLTMDVQIKVPQDAEPGGHYAALIVSTTEPSQENGAAINLTHRLSCLFLLKVAGPINEVGSLEAPEIPGFSEYGPVPIDLVFKNQGNVHLEPQGHVVITNLLGQTVADIPVHEWVVLPDAARRTAVAWNTKYSLGRYTASAEITYGSGKTKVIASSSFWVIPWKIILAAVVVLILIIALIIVIRRHRRPARNELKKEIRQLKEKAGGEEAPAGGEQALRQEPEADHVPLNELFSSMDDPRLVDLNDSETQKIIREIIADQLDLARSLLGQGEIEEAHRELREARFAAQRIGLLSEVGIIDDMLLGH